MIQRNDACRIRVLYSGRVQGVGFRWQVKQVSEGFAVTGFVRNLEDGTVELLVEGDARQARGMIEAVDERLRGFWTSKAEDEREGEPHYEDFSIDYP